MTETVQRWIALALAAPVLIAAIVGVAVRDDDEVVALASPTPSAAVVVTDKPKATKKPAAAVTARPSAPAGSVTTTTPVPARTDSAPDRSSGGVTQPKAGTYTYKETRDGETSNEPLEISDTGTNKQRETEEEIESEIIWKSTGKYIDKMDFGFFQCDWNPDILELKLPFKTGSSWSINGSCSPGNGATITFKGTTKVVGPAKRPVEGKQIDTWHLKTNATFEFKTPQGNFKQTGTFDDYFAPSAGVYVYSVEKTSGTDPTTGQQESGSATSQLISLTPS